ncbi:MAG TPA: DUF6508 domain-containing protein [Patescibacteria group bacterium]|nr:DUF6508 domain-containing protein [Patescibacteria group bacterium]
MRISKASLRILAGYVEAFEPHGPIGRWQGGEADAGGVIQMPWYEYQPEVERFVEDMYAAKLVRSIDWMRWAGTPEAQRLTSDPTAISGASHDDLINLLTTIIRGERFGDSEIAGAYERGTLLAIAQRAHVLLGDGPG